MGPSRTSSNLLLWKSISEGLFWRHSLCLLALTCMVNFLSFNTYDPLNELQSFVICSISFCFTSIHVFDKYLLNVCSSPDTVPGTGSRERSKAGGWSQRENRLWGKSSALAFALGQRESSYLFQREGPLTSANSFMQEWGGSYRRDWKFPGEKRGRIF